MNNKRKEFNVGDKVICVMGTRTLVEGNTYTITWKDTDEAADGMPFHHYLATDNCGNQLVIKNGHLSFSKVA